MKISETKIKDVLIIEPDVFRDNRGSFFESYHRKKWKEAGIDADFVQDNYSFNKNKYTLRGLHLQAGSSAQAKLVRVTRGFALDVFVDLRSDSPTFKKWSSVEISSENKKTVFIPRGFAHGFLTLSDDVEFEYKVDNYYDKASERRIRFDDPEIKIEWGVDDPILSEEDKNSPYLKDCDFSF